MAKIFRWSFVGVLILIVILQVVSLPVLNQQMNPPVVQEPVWVDLQTRDIAQRACFDCHSNETHWPLYSKIAPVSWLITKDVVEGRETLNFSEWNKVYEEADEVGEVIQEGEMPLWFYLPLHPEAQLSETEKQQLIDGMNATLGLSSQQESTEHEADHDESDEEDHD